MMRLVAEAVTHCYGEHVVLRNVSVAIPDGQVHVVAGPNGSGKSTLLRILALLEAPTAGRVLVAGEAPGPGQLVARRREMVLVAQPPYLFHGTVWGNVAYGLNVRRLQRSEVRERVEAAIAWAGLESIAQQGARTLSVGQAQLVNLARAVALEPKVLLVDEPTAGLDVRNAERVEQLVASYAAERQTTVVLVTHHLPQARRLAQELTLLYDGEVVDSGPLDQLLQRCQDHRAAGFLSEHLVF